MKSKLVLFFLLLTSAFSHAQQEYKKVYAYGDYQKDWALVKTVAGTYGIIDRDRKIVVQPIYAKIERFTGEFARVKTVAGTYGLIDKSGKEVVNAIYASIGKFGEYANNIALVKTVAGTYGFVNKSGKEIVAATYFELEEAKVKLKIVNIE